MFLYSKDRTIICDERQALIKKVSPNLIKYMLPGAGIVFEGL